jgi:hypothetical protein
LPKFLWGEALNYVTYIKLDEIFDFDSAYLNSTLAEDEVMYLEQPKGYEKADRKKIRLQAPEGSVRAKTGRTQLV